MAPNKPVELTGEELEEAKKNNELLVVDFYADWCAPCKQMEPIMESLAKDMGDKAFIGKVNVDDEKEVAMEHQVSSIPAIIFFKDGKVQEKLVGAKTEEDLKEKINNYAE